MSDIICVVPTIRPDRMGQFKLAWADLFRKHEVTLVTVWDGEVPAVTFADYGIDGFEHELPPNIQPSWVCRHTDSVRNLGFLVAAKHKPDYVLTLDDDVLPTVDDPIQAHLDALSKRVPLDWMNTAHRNSPYLRGVPYDVRDQAPVMLSHGVWIGVPDFDGETQLRMEKEGFIPQVLPYYHGPVPRGVLFPLCGMNVMVKAEALPYLYYAPMGPDADVWYMEGTETLAYSKDPDVKKVPALHRFGDIWMGVFLKRAFDRTGWACYTGASVVLHSRASNAEVNFFQERLGRVWNERVWDKKDSVNEYGPGMTHRYDGSPLGKYLTSYADKRRQFHKDITDALKGQS